MKQFSRLLTIIIILSSCATKQTYLSNIEVLTKSTCNISLSKAKQNLIRHEYNIVNEAGNRFKTSLLLNKKLQEKRLLGSISKDIHEGYEITSNEKKQIQFKVLQQTTNYIHPGNEDDSSDPSISTDYLKFKSLKQLNSYRKKVCNSTVYAKSAPTPKTDSSLLQNNCLEGIKNDCFKLATIEAKKGNRKKADSLIYLGCHHNSKMKECLQ